MRVSAQTGALRSLSGIIQVSATISRWEFDVLRAGSVTVEIRCRDTSRHRSPEPCGVCAIVHHKPVIAQRQHRLRWPAMAKKRTIKKNLPTTGLIAHPSTDSSIDRFAEEACATKVPELICYRSVR